MSDCGIKPAEDGVLVFGRERLQELEREKEEGREEEEEKGELRADGLEEDHLLI